MKNLLQFKRTHLSKIALLFLVGAIFFGAACGSKPTSYDNTPAGLIIVKSPADGIISKVFVSEGATVGENAGIVEIESLSETQTAPINEKTDKSVGGNLQAIEAEITNAENEVKRTSVEVSRVESLVAANSVPQAQLDAARADFQKAQESLQNVRKKKRNQETALLIEKSRGETASSGSVADNEVIVVRTVEAGILKVLNARVGQKVRSGQPLATVLK